MHTDVIILWATGLLSKHLEPQYRLWPIALVLLCFLDAKHDICAVGMHTLIKMLSWAESATEVAI
jgi:hypothetical protein